MEQNHTSTQICHYNENNSKCINNVISNSTYCKQHKCLDMDCPRQIHKNKHSMYCGIHCCNFGNCVQHVKDAPNQSYCDNHACLICHRLKQNNKTFCKFHVCGEPECNQALENDTNTKMACPKHRCHVENCNSLIMKNNQYDSYTVKDIYCYSHKCNHYSKCNNKKIANSDYCGIHICNIPECKTPSYKNNVCCRHICGCNGNEYYCPKHMCNGNECGFEANMQVDIKEQFYPFDCPVHSNTYYKK